MAFRSRRRGFRTVARRNQNMRVWTAVTLADQEIFNDPAFTVADAAAFATTSGNTKHIGTLVRIRGHISIFNTTANTATFSYGLSLADVTETTPSVTTSTWARDEDVLVWEANRLAHGSSVGGFPTYIPIDVKAKRRLDVEGIVKLEIGTTSSEGVLLASFSLRALFLVP